MVSGCVGFVGVFALTFGSFLVRTIPFVRKVSRIFQVGTFPARLPSPRLLSAVDGQDDDVLGSYAEIYGVGKPIQDGAARFSSHKAKLHWTVREARDRLVQRCAELGAKAGSPTFVPVARFECFSLSFRPETDATAHSRSRSFRRTSSHGMAESGR
jgi:hypothetical protein